LGDNEPSTTYDFEGTTAASCAAPAYLQVHARLADAKEILEQALASDEAVHGPDHPADAAALLPERGW